MPQKYVRVSITREELETMLTHLGRYSYTPKEIEWLWRHVAVRHMRWDKLKEMAKSIKMTARSMGFPLTKTRLRSVDTT